MSKPKIDNTLYYHTKSLLNGILPLEYAIRAFRENDHSSYQYLSEKNEIIEYLDFPDDLWGIGNSVGYQDESKGCVQQILSSLYLIQVSNLKLYTNNFNEKIRPRASFSYNSINYDLAVTCLAFNDYMRTSSNYDSAILCISLGEPYSVDNRCYKLVASIYI